MRWSIEPAYVEVNTFVSFSPSYPVSPPSCTVGPAACQVLWDEWYTGSGAFPTCSAPSTSYSVATNTAGGLCDTCEITAEVARLLYWPVTTKGAFETNLCRPPSDIETIPGERTSQGPSTFVTAGVTITSPSVGVWVSGLRRLDSCHTSIRETVLVADADQFYSVKSFHAYAELVPLNFADLNTACADNDPAKCYTQVPGDAYFGGEVNDGQYQFGYLTPWNATRTMTIWNDYHPYIAPPEVVTSLFVGSADVHGIHTDCYVYPIGVWE